MIIDRQTSFILRMSLRCLHAGVNDSDVKGKPRDMRLTNKRSGYEQTKTQADDQRSMR
jgi:hypothetical protein